MDVPDIARVIALLLDNATLEKLYVLGLIPSLSSFIYCQRFQYERVCLLVCRALPFSSDIDWKQTHRLLDDRLSNKRYLKFYNAHDNVTVLELLSWMGYKPTGELEVACRYGKPKIVRYLLCLSNDRAIPALLLINSTQHGHEACVDVLLADPRVQPNSSVGNRSPLMCACSAVEGNADGRYTRIAEKLLVSGAASLYFDWNRAMTEACRHGDNADVVKVLLKWRSYTRQELITAINKAWDWGRDEICKLLARTLDGMEPEADN